MQTHANIIYDRQSLARVTGVVLGTLLTGSVLALWLWVVAAARWHVLAAPGPATVADALTLLLAVAALLLLLWFAIGVALESLAVLPGATGRWATRSADRLTPALAARVAALLLGSAVATGALPTTAVADTTGSGARTAVVATAPDPGFAPPGATSSGTAATAEPGSGAAPDPGFLPTRPVVRRIVAPAVISPPGGLPAPGGVVVHRGDTLWAIAARDLGPHATDAEVAARWPRWYAANRQVIGPDPDRILPGQVLVRPAGEVTP